MTHNLKQIIENNVITMQNREKILDARGECEFSYHGYPCIHDTPNTQDTPLNLCKKCGSLGCKYGIKTNGEGCINCMISPRQLEHIENNKNIHVVFWIGLCHKCDEIIIKCKCNYRSKNIHYYKSYYDGICDECYEKN